MQMKGERLTNITRRLASLFVRLNELTNGARLLLRKPVVAAKTRFGPGVVISGFPEALQAPDEKT
jgi:hypothetical protein